MDAATEAVQKESSNETKNSEPTAKSTGCVVLCLTILRFGRFKNIEKVYQRKTCLKSVGLAPTTLKSMGT